ncbi:hypothetical protein PAXRUDRAFT_824960 [Paxillus rubicundulus Ve08.2h10]|uniref:Uncharacterized protein n=1 Tax=Paxillus rubicundulus Ve08.2h10 TaxID=930991 RepID=A0A0D0E762_9AGAM|nr:hypothetical protein PAXRUDRAFT_824960 [Paxillus rubicundulus Ve08.2h10]
MAVLGPAIKPVRGGTAAHLEIPKGVGMHGTVGGLRPLLDDHRKAPIDQTQAWYMPTRSEVCLSPLDAHRGCQLLS